VDSHLVIATVDAPLGVLRARDLPPFEAAIAAGVRALMPGHLRVPELTGDLPASLSRRALTDLLRGELGFTGVIVSDGLEMRAVSEPYGIPEAAALLAAVRSGRLPGARLEEAATRVAELRAWTLAAGPTGRPIGSTPGRQANAGADRATPDGIAASSTGLAAARRAILITGTPPALRRPLVVQLVPPPNLAVGAVPWGLSRWVPAGSYREISTGTSGRDLAGLVSGLLAEAADRTLIIVIRDAHRHPVIAEVVLMFLAGRPDAVVLEMGLPVWRPPAGSYLASYGAARTSERRRRRDPRPGRPLASPRAAAPERHRQAGTGYLHNAAYASVRSLRLCSARRHRACRLRRRSRDG
jgi:beta-N-acetylhexosaminidase